MKKGIEDIAIIGGGPAGSYLGYLLAKNGLHPIIFDYSHPREKPCGGGVSAFALEKFSFLHEIPTENTPEAEFESEIRSPEGFSVMIRGDKPSWTISRLLLDKFILDKAIDSGSKLINEKVIDITPKGDIWEIKTDAGIYKAKIIIGADGVNSIVRKKILSPIPTNDIGICYGCFATSNKKETPLFKYFKNKQGYAWCFPRQNNVSIGVGVDSSNSKNVKTLFEEFITSNYPDVDILSKWGAKIPNIKDIDFYKTPCAGKNWILIGDAAGHVDPITGDGITYALWSAELASKAIMNNDPCSFDQLWRNEYGDNLIAGCKMRHTFYNPFLLEFSLWIASKSKIASSILYDVMNSQQYYSDFFKNIFKSILKKIKPHLH